MDKIRPEIRVPGFCTKCSESQINEIGSTREEVARQIVERYTTQLKAIIRWKLNERIRRKEGTSDILQDVFKSFFEHKPKLHDPDNLFTVLCTFARRKVINTVQKYESAKRDYRLDSRSLDLDCDNLEEYLFKNSKVTIKSTQEEAAAIIDLIECLPEKLQTLLHLLMQNYSYKEISENMNCSEKTIQRMVKEVRERWKGIVDV